MAKDPEANTQPLETSPATAQEPAAPMTPAAALARHVEWLEHALTAARDEEARRQGRLERATEKNRARRMRKLAEVSAEVRELDALVRGIRDLQARAARPQAGSVRRTATAVGTPAAASSPRRSRAAGAVTTKAAKDGGTS